MNENESSRLSPETLREFEGFANFSEETLNLAIMTLNNLVSIAYNIKNTKNKNLLP